MECGNYVGSWRRRGRSGIWHANGMVALLETDKISCAFDMTYSMDDCCVSHCRDLFVNHTLKLWVWGTERMVPELCHS